MTRLLIATDSDGVFAELDAALGDDNTTIDRVRTGAEVRGAVVSSSPDLVILDLQIGNMGGIAAALDLRNEESAERVSPQRILLLVDREADAFLAGRSGADGWIIKPLDALRIRHAAGELLRRPAATPS